MSEKNPKPWFEIDGFDGKSLKLHKRSGSWLYKLRPGEISSAVALELAERVVDGKWSILGIAYFVEHPTNPKILKLVRVGL